MILVTGAAGKTGLAVIKALARGRQPVRALVFRPEQQAAALAAGARETIVGDMLRPGVILGAMQATSAVYHIAPNMSPHEIEMGALAIRTAQEARIDRFIYHSVLQPQIEAMPHHWQKLRVEEKLLQSGLAFTILQPAAYMQNILAGWGTIISAGQYRVPYPTNTSISLVDLLDVAEVATMVLTESGHEGATYELVGTLPLSQEAVAAALSRSLGRKVSAVELRVEAWRATAQAAGMPVYTLDSLVQMFHYYAEHGFAGNPRVLSCLLGGEPRSLPVFLQNVIAAQDV